MDFIKEYLGAKMYSEWKGSSLDIDCVRLFCVWGRCCDRRGRPEGFGRGAAALLRSRAALKLRVGGGEESGRNVRFRIYQISCCSVLSQLPGYVVRVTSVLGLRTVASGGTFLRSKSGGVTHVQDAGTNYGKRNCICI
jgi:hypothetical protein